jgi:hypothetical protein
MLLKPISTVVAIVCITGSISSAADQNRSKIPVTITPQGQQAALKRWITEVGPECGVNALYVVLRLRDKAISYDDLRASVPTTDAGANMVDLKCAAAEFGLDMTVVESPLRALRPHAPCIIRLSGMFDSHSGHYVVLANAWKDDELEIIDATTGTVSITNESTIAGVYSGYALVANTRQTNLRRVLSCLLIIALPIPCIILGIRYIPRTHQRPTKYY